MKRIGVVTCSGSSNFGTCLQAFSLLHQLSRLGYEPILLRKKFYENNLLNYIISFGRIIGIYSYWENFKLKCIQKKDLKSIKPPKKVEAWDKANINVFNIWFPFQYSSFLRHVDCLVTGSDQIWNSYVGFDRDMYLSFAKDKKRIAYSSSIGTNNVNPVHAEEIKTLLLKFCHISVRERTGVQALQNLTGRNDIQQVLDPTLLINNDEWHSIASKAKAPVDTSSRYIACYLLGHSNSYYGQIEKVKELTKIQRVVVIPSSENRNLAPEDAEICRDIDPFEFVKIIEKSSFVCTDSFHATAFSINLQKPFVEFKRFNDADSESQNSRLYDLLKHFNLMSRIFDRNSQEWASQIDFKTSASILAEDRAFSIKFLKDAIEN